MWSLLTKSNILLIFRGKWYHFIFQLTSPGAPLRSARDGFRERGALDHHRFWGPMQVWPIWSLVLKTWKYATLTCITPQNLIFCGADFGSTIALDLRQKLKLLLHSSQKQMAMRSFRGIYGSSLRYISVIFSVFCGFIFRIDTLSCETVLPPSKISSSCRSH